MRLHSGPVPDDPNFHPQAQGWNSIRHDPSPLVISLLVVPVAVILIYFLFWLISLLFPRGGPVLSGWYILLPLVLVIPVHELIHAVCYPAFGLTSDTIIGVWARRRIFYAYYQGALPRNRLLLVYAAPFVVLTLVLMPVLAWLHSMDLAHPLLSVLWFISLINGVLCAGDVIGFLLLLWQVPRRALVKNQGWKTYWKPMQVSG